MAPKRRQERQQHPVQSDYDTETAGQINTEQNVPKRSIDELNIVVLRRYLPDIQRIVSIAPFAVVYIFSPETQQWEKSGVEGTLFVCQLAGEQHPRYNAVILNRKSLDNFITELVSADDVEITDEYVILQVLGGDGTPRIFGLWIYSEEEKSPTTREIVAMAIQECAFRAQQGKDPAPEEDERYEDMSEDYVYEMEDPASQPASQSQLQPSAELPGRQVDLLSLFAKPQIQAETHIHEAPTNSAPQVSQQGPKFNIAPDTAFFHSLQSPGMQQPLDQPNASSTQQSALLGLFKNAKRG